ncbi:MAG: hypothetical protein QOJ96_2755 [Alphaproteobacteria bacterium]|nr:hypothetical protein [Alphaproteobacteria bacterium]
MFPASTDNDHTLDHYVAVYSLRYEHEIELRQQLARHTRERSAEAATDEFIGDCAIQPFQFNGLIGKQPIQNFPARNVAQIEFEAGSVGTSAEMTIVNGSERSVGN